MQASTTAVFVVMPLSMYLYLECKSCNAPVCAMFITHIVTYLLLISQFLLLHTITTARVVLLCEDFYFSNATALIELHRVRHYNK